MKLPFYANCVKKCIKIHLNIWSLTVIHLLTFSHSSFIIKLLLQWPLIRSIGCIKFLNKKKRRKEKPVSHLIESEIMLFNSLFKIIIYLKLIVKPMVWIWWREEKRQKIPNHRKRIQTVQLTKGSYIWYKRHSLFKTNSFVLVSIFFFVFCYRNLEQLLFL